MDAIRGLEHPSQVEIAVDGRRVFLAAVGGEANLKFLFENPRRIPTSSMRGYR